ncbi:MAG TPA: hypothetical protein VK206_13020, partial [Anaerolineales bacterium]|nr:hypothetical protein [Anaerolineales bacterium]
MDFNWSIIAWIAALLFVYVFGLIEGRGKGYKKRKAEEAQEKKDQPPAKPEVVTVDDPGLLRIKNENGAFALDLDGTRVNPISLSSEQRKRLIEVLNIMRPWLEGSPAPSLSSSATVVPPPQPKPVPIQTTSSASPPSPQPSDATQGRSTSPRPATIAKEDRPSAPA